LHRLYVLLTGWTLRAAPTLGEASALTPGPTQQPGAPCGNSSTADDELPPELLCGLLDLPAELLVAVAMQLDEDDDLAASLACRNLRQAVAGTERRRAGAWLSTKSARHSAR
jgi:hypothetical protein